MRRIVIHASPDDSKYENQLRAHLAPLRNHANIDKPASWHRRVDVALVLISSSFLSKYAEKGFVKIDGEIVLPVIVRNCAYAAFPIETKQGRFNLGALSLLPSNDRAVVDYDSDPHDNAWTLVAARVEELLRKVELKAPHTSHVPDRENEDQVPPLLPFLVNRDAHDDEIATFLRTAKSEKRSAIVVLSGNESHCLDSHVEKLFEKVVPDALDLAEGRSGLWKLPVSWPESRVKNVPVYLQHQLANTVKAARRGSTEPPLANPLSGVPVLVTRLYQTDLCRYGAAEAFDNFLTFFRGMDVGLRTLPISFVVVQFDGSRRPLFSTWLPFTSASRAYRFIGRDLGSFGSERGIPLKVVSLGEIEERPALEWLEKPEVRDYCKSADIDVDELKRQIEHFYRSCRLESLPMSVVSEQLRRLLSPRSLDRMAA